MAPASRYNKHAGLQIVQDVDSLCHRTIADTHHAKNVHLALKHCFALDIFAKRNN